MLSVRLYMRGNVLSIDVINLLEKFQKGDESAFSEIYEQYKPLMLSMVNSILLSSFPEEASSEHDVFMQEATMALYNAAKSFDIGQSGVTFGLYAKICIKNRLFSVKRKIISARKKEQRLMRGGVTQAKVRGDEGYNPRRKLAGISLSGLIENDLSDFEKKVFDLYLQNMSYKEIAECLKVSEKAVDNAIYRIRRKLKKHK